MRQTRRQWIDHRRKPPRRRIRDNPGHAGRDKPDAATYIGSGKARELRDVVIEEAADTVICDGELTPGQLIQLEDVVKVKVVDRTWLILDIFAQHAKSREGKAQVSLAQPVAGSPAVIAPGMTLHQSPPGGLGFQAASQLPLGQALPEPAPRCQGSGQPVRQGWLAQQLQEDVEAGHAVRDRVGRDGRGERRRALERLQALDLVFCALLGGVVDVSEVPVGGRPSD